ncbi:MAG: AcvB/VirJ family lysyl-phosphatidylglycerol hydrolase, partial [Gemmatimonadota bacterium]|nr:AcvB/VirJ family lysyl-phosphatidylglycerol hydrolase [Gemmatimonadota bacterium]
GASALVDAPALSSFTMTRTSHLRIVAALSLAALPTRAQPPATRSAMLPVTAVAPAAGGSRLVLVITGEAGRTAFEASLARALAAAGDGVLVLDSRTYLSEARAPERVAADVAAALQRYERTWKRDQVVIVGYSRGADLAPFIANRLDAAVRSQLAGVVMVAPAGRAAFEITLRDVMGGAPRPTDLPVMPELERLRGTPMLCAYGREERQPFCARLDSTLATVVVRAGGHRLADPDGRAVARLITDRFGR